MSKRLIIHLDDFGVLPEVNLAGKILHKMGAISSASVIFPADYSNEILENIDIGIHLTAICEWNAERWNSFSKVVFPKTQEELNNMEFDIQEEFLRQIEYAEKKNIKFSHLDNHMWVSCSTPELFSKYLKLAKDNNVIAYIPDWALFSDDMKKIVSKYDFPVINTVKFGNGNYFQMKKQLTDELKAIDDGIYLLTTHATLKSPKSTQLIKDIEHRYNEFKVLEGITDILKEEKIQLINFSDLQIG